MQSNRFDYILWDVDDTLLLFHPAQEYAFVKTMSEFLLPSGEEYHAIYEEYNRKLWEEFDKGMVTKEFLLVERFRRYLNHINSDISPEVINERYLNNLSNNSVLMPHAYETVSAIASMGIKQYIITNAVSFVNRRRIANSSLAPFFDEIFVSEEIGYAKPDKRYYDAVFDKIDGFNLERALAVGDSLSSDIAGGYNAGVKTCLYNPKGKENKTSYTPDYEVGDLCQILKIITNEA